MDFYFVKREINLYNRRLYVKKSSPFLSDGRDVLNVTELYDGSNTPLVYYMEKNMEFFCKFDNIKNYPFGVQSCSFSFGLTGPANKLTKLNSVLSLHPSVENMNIGQYEILNWTMETKTTHSNQTVVIVTMNLTRYFTNMVVSL